MADTSASIVRRRIDEGPLSGLQISVIFIGFLLNFVDGFDVVAMSVAAPSLSAEWRITPTESGYILSAALVGMTLGAMFLAPIADRIGRRNALMLATILIGVSMIATALIPESVELMMLVRMISGLGIGVIFANSAAIGSEFAPERYRNIAVTLIVMGYPFGAMLVGPFADVVIPTQGWRMVFVYGGLFTLCMTAVIFFFLSESVEYLSVKAQGDARSLERINTILTRMKRAPIEAPSEPSMSAPVKPATVGQLFNGGLTLPTLGVWAIYFLGFLTVYFLLSWIPTLFVNSGYTRSEGIRALTIHNLGAVFGILLIGLIATRIKLAKPIAAYFVGSAICLALIFYLKTQSLFTLNAFIFAVGFLLQGAFTAMYALTARVYPTQIRATGIGWAAGLGRTGAILSPIIAGYLVANGWGMYGLFLLFAAPAVVAGILASAYKH